MEFGSVEYQLAIWNLFNLGRIGNAMIGIGSILAIWLAFRVALNTRNNPETNILTKVLSSAFGLMIVMGTWINFTESVAYYVNTAAAFADIKARGSALSPAAEGFIEYVGTSTTKFAGTPTPLGMLFLSVVTIIIMAQIWMPKK